MIAAFRFSRISFCSILFVFSFRIWSYPNFIGYGYQSCLTCHYNPLGNGPLSDYGRALGATIVADRLLSSQSASEEEIGQNSGFLYSEAKSQWLRPSVNYRGLFIERDFGQPRPIHTSDYIHMDANLNFVLLLGPKGRRDQFIAALSTAYAPPPKAAQGRDTGPRYRSREHYLGYRFGEHMGLYLGLMDKAFGLRIPDHTAYSRMNTNLGQNDQTHGLLFHYGHPRLELGLHAFVGSLNQEKDVRQKGYSGQIEFSLNRWWRPGLSYLKSHSQFLEQSSQAIHLRAGFGKGSSLMSEWGQTKKTQIQRGEETISRYWLLQNHLLLRRGLFGLITVEHFKGNKERDHQIWRIGPGFQWFPQRSIEIRTDLYNIRSFDGNFVGGDIWNLAGQVHLWF